MDRVDGDGEHGPGDWTDGADYRRTYDWGETRPSMAVVEVVAAATRRRPTDLAPLFGTVDPDALDGLLAGARATRPGTSVSFTYAGCELVLDGDGTVRATPLE